MPVQLCYHTKHCSIVFTRLVTEQKLLVACKVREYGHFITTLPRSLLIVVREPGGLSYIVEGLSLGDL